MVVYGHFCDKLSQLTKIAPTDVVSEPKIPGADRPMDMEPNVINIEDTSNIIRYEWYYGLE
jgi:hypothetical protein